MLFDLIASVAKKWRNSEANYVMRVREGLAAVAGSQESPATGQGSYVTV